jgi:hypothetical protein
MYYDLNVPWNEDSQVRLPNLLRLFEKCNGANHFQILFYFSVGYSAVGINHVSVGKLPKSVSPSLLVPVSFLLEVPNSKSCRGIEKEASHQTVQSLNTCP